jgi:hypothetical protein
LPKMVGVKSLPIYPIGKERDGEPGRTRTSNPLFAADSL